MCGINGFLAYQSLSEKKITHALQKMNRLIAHRGPDDAGFFTHLSTDFSLGMAMRRLAIIDLKSGQQPVFNKDKSIALVFNGEIYNYKQLRKNLESSGISFSTQSDTEVILKLYEAKGIASFKELDGMYAFSIFDKSKNKLVIARDFFGEKPLYYYNSNELFLWASELKSIRSTLPFIPEIAIEGLNLFFKLTYIPAPFPIYKNIYKLEPTSCLEFNLEAKHFTVSKIHTEKKPKPEAVSFETAKKNVRKTERESIESRAVSDVPLGTFLSGGVDSSIVSFGLSQTSSNPIDTFSIGFKKKAFDETQKSRTVANLIQSNHHEFILTEEEIEHSLNEILLNFDEPFADSSALPTYLVSNKTSEHVKVALTGDGGD